MTAFLRASSVLPAFAAAALLGCLGAIGARAEAGTDPTVWERPEERPRFRELVKDDAYRERLESFLGKVDKAALEKSVAPVYSLKIVAVAEGSALEALGLGAGGHILGVRGSTLWSAAHLSALPGRVPRRFIFQTAEGQRKAARLLPKDLKVNVIPGPGGARG